MSGACCIRLRTELKNRTVDEIIEIMRMLRLHRKDAVVYQKNITLDDYLNNIIEKITKEGKAGKIKTQYLAVVVKSPVLKIDEHSKEIAGLVSWQKDWRNFNEEYVKYLLDGYIPTKYKNGFVLAKFPATLIHIPQAPEKTYEIYLFTVELARVQLHMLKIYSHRLDDLAKRINNLLEGESRNLSIDLWSINKLRLEILQAVDDVRRMRDVLQIHRLLWVFDKLAEESMIERLYEHIQHQLKNIDEIITNCYNVLHAEYSRREQMEIYYLQSIFIVGVIVQAIMLLFIKITDFTPLGFPLIVTAVFLAFILFQLFRKIVSKKMENYLYSKKHP